MSPSNIKYEYKLVDASRFLVIWIPRTRPEILAEEKIYLPMGNEKYCQEDIKTMNRFMKHIRKYQNAGLKYV